MWMDIALLGTFFLVLSLATAQIDECPATDLACHDVMNSSQCIEQLVLESRKPVARDALVKCVEHEGTASSLPGAVKYCRCPGCHTEPITAVIKKLFPPPCV